MGEQVSEGSEELSLITVSLEDKRETLRETIAIMYETRRRMQTLIRENSISNSSQYVIIVFKWRSVPLGGYDFSIPEELRSSKKDMSIWHKLFLKGHKNIFFEH